MFKVGDRVEYTAEKLSSFNYGKGDTCVILELVNKWNVNVRWDHDGAETTPDPHYLKLITEEPMNVITALEKSITHWQEIVAVFGGAKVEDKRLTPKMGSVDCALCGFFGFDNKGVLACDDCPAENCTRTDSHYSRVRDTTTNAKAYEASQAMLSRLEELLVEELAKAKKEEAAIRVGDVVMNSICSNDRRKKAKFSGVVYEVTDDGAVKYTSATGYDGACNMSSFILIHRPTKEAK